MKVVTAKGVVSHSSVPPRESVGSDLRRLVFGSEGCIGIITEATIKLFDAPEVQRYRSVISPIFSAGLNSCTISPSEARSRRACVWSTTSSCN